MNNPEIEYLYKYYAYNVNSISTLINRQIWFADPESFNDPFDCHYKYPNDFNPSFIEPLKTQYLGEVEANKLEAIASIGPFDVEYSYKTYYDTIVEKMNTSNVGLFCLSECNDNILMWSHYADLHKGFCIKFKRSENNLLKYARRVSYPPDYKIVSAISNEAISRKYFTKSADWKYEKEWRLLKPKKNVLDDLPGEIVSIVFGLRMPEEHKNTIRNILLDLHSIKYFQAHRVQDQFKLQIELIDN